MLMVLRLLRLLLMLVLMRRRRRRKLLLLLLKESPSHLLLECPRGIGVREGWREVLCLRARLRRVWMPLRWRL